MFGYVRPYRDELLVRQYEQYKAVYCQLCKTLERRYGWLAKFSLSYDCTFYALLALSVSGDEPCARAGRCRANPLKKCRYLEAAGEAYEKAAALQVLLTGHKLEDDREDEGFFRGLGARLLLPLVSRKRKKAAAAYPFLAELARRAAEQQHEAEAARAGLDACAEPTARLLADLFEELSEDGGQRLALSQFGYFLGRWVYLMDAADDLAEDRKRGRFNPFRERWGGLEQAELEQRCNEALNATVAQMLPALNLIELHNFGPIVENVARFGLPEIQREILFLHIKEKKRHE